MKNPQSPDWRSAPDDEVLRLVCWERDETAFTMLYERYEHRVWDRLFFLVTNREAADDLQQEVFIRVWQRISPAVELYFEKWLNKITRNIAFDYLRHVKKFTWLPLPGVEEQDTIDYIHWKYGKETREEDHTINRLFIEEVLSEMSQTAPKCHICLVLYAQWGYTQREIAEMLDVSPKTVNANLRQAYLQVEKISAKFRAKMDDQHKPGEGGC